ncbi:hypothetical protein F441_10792 [Phytophthora nicotianae CJ01A1]|uniref:Uncharacterized protein n=2 Tax=Phytophthora nicotianae TaxID=4792 RepID=W2GNA6_PHYNI|nr:hypothetical protein L915_10602 [Phytophthora nicotianae]ETM44297.1 hypothetical protein L914_10453 [Phytophthora nicotianae]ETP14258.1 hypothetical protein F441_10792 [Phytophthora nicotianae CJ01A1]
MKLAHMLHHLKLGADDTQTNIERQQSERQQDAILDEETKEDSLCLNEVLSTIQVDLWITLRLILTRKTTRGLHGMTTNCRMTMTWMTASMKTGHLNQTYSLMIRCSI